MRRTLVAAACVACLPSLAAAGADSAAIVRSLDEYGPAGTVEQAGETFAKAAAEIVAGGGGVLVIPATAAAKWLPRSPLQEEWRKPAPPAPAKSWGVGPGITVVDLRSGNSPAPPGAGGDWRDHHGEQPRRTHGLLPPQVSGLQLARTLKLPEGQSLPHWNSNPMIKMDNTIARGSTSYRDWLQENVAKGADRRFYVPTIRGIFPGMFLNAGDFGAVPRLFVKSLGFDAGRQRWYFVADTGTDVAAGTILHNKSHVNVMRMDTYSHNENQTFDLMLWRHNYSQGDNSLVDARFSYMGDVHSTAGDENGVLFAGFVRGASNIFRGTVASWDAATAALTFADATNDHTLGSGRPVVNLNPAKWVSRGSAFIMHPGGAKLGWGGTIRSADADWTPDLVGRYFAVDEPDEYVPGGDTVRRWYLITSVDRRDGVSSLGVQRHWWGAKNNVSVGSLYNAAHYTTDAKRPKPLRYVIAPGVNAVDVSEGLPAAGGRRLLRLSPPPFAGTAADFAVGDRIEQAIGPDPFHPIPFRAWMWDLVPGIFPSSVFDIANNGRVRRHSVLSVAGGSGDLQKDRGTRADRAAAWSRIVGLQASCRNGIVFEADVAGAAILFSQPRVAAGFPQVVKWRAAVPRSLGVGPAGSFAITGAAPLAVAGKPVAAVAGLSGDATPAANLRGVGVGVPAGSTSLEVALSRPEASDTYAVIVRPSWIASHAVTRTDTRGFTVEFDRPAPADARIDWLLVR